MKKSSSSRISRTDWPRVRTLKDRSIKTSAEDPEAAVKHIVRGIVPGRSIGSLAVMDTPGVDTLPRFGNGFVLRRLACDDLPEFQAYRHDPELGRYQGWSPMSDDEAIAFLGEMNTTPLLNPGHWTQIGIAEPDTRRLIGDIGMFLDQDGRHAKVGFTLARHAQGRGVATVAVREAINLIFAATKVDRVLGITDARNSASVRLLERVGMRKTETTNAVFRGERCVEYVYTVLRNDG